LNIVFDLGGVVVTWEPESIIAKVFYKDESRQQAYKEIFNHKDWVELDRGVLDERDAIHRATARTGFSKSIVERLFRQVPISLVLIPETVELIKYLKNKGHRLFVLSNMHKTSINYLEQEHSFWDVFEARVISCRVRMVKPEAKIYRYLLNRYRLLAEKTVFIDDSAANIQAASKVGINTIQFKNADQCKQELSAMGII
jgi:putative hydrolase of the HAD superfamily